MANQAIDSYFFEELEDQIPLTPGLGAYTALQTTLLSYEMFQCNRESGFRLINHGIL